MVHQATASLRSPPKRCVGSLNSMPSRIESGAGRRSCVARCDRSWPAARRLVEDLARSRAASSGPTQWARRCHPLRAGPLGGSADTSRMRRRLDTNTVERAIPPIALGRKNHLFAGSDGGADRWAIVCSLITTAKLNDREPYAYLKDVLDRLTNGHPASRIDDLLPWNWVPQS